MLKMSVICIITIECPPSIDLEAACKYRVVCMLFAWVQWGRIFTCVVLTAGVRWHKKMCLQTWIFSWKSRLIYQRVFVYVHHSIGNSYCTCCNPLELVFWIQAYAYILVTPLKSPMDCLFLTRPVLAKTEL